MKLKAIVKASHSFPAQAVVTSGESVLKAGELAARLQVSERKIRKMVAMKEIPVVRIGRLLRFAWPDVLRALTGLAANSAEMAEMKGGTP